MINKQKFMWGVATSSYQTEGGIRNNDWHYFGTSDSIRKRISDLTTPSIFYKDIRHVQLEPAGDGLRLWESRYYLRDFENAKNLGLNSFRISLEWSRIEPEKNQWDQKALDIYREMLLSMRERDLEPIVTLNHLTLPLWVLTPPLEFKKNFYQYILPQPLRSLPIKDPPSSDPYWRSLRGWESEETVQEFINFVGRVVSEFKDLVDYWITINEPVASVIGGGYLAGISPPGFFLDGKRARIVLHNLIEAHVQTYDKITELDDIDANEDGVPKNIGLSHLMLHVEPVAERSFLKRKTQNIDAAKNYSYFMNEYFLNAIINGEEDLNYLNTLEICNKASKDFIVHDDWKKKLDFIGLNYYRREHVQHNFIISKSGARFIGGIPISDLSNKKNSELSLNDLGWEIYPEGLYQIIKSLKRFDLPIFITENGVADKSDDKRPRFIIGHMKQIKRCLDQGVDILGYLHWSLMDNYEWHEGYRPDGKFGLYYVNHEESNHHRKITTSASILKLIIEESFLNNEYGLISDEALTKAELKYCSS